MKLNKDQIQKVSLSSLLFAFVLYGYFSFLLAPLSRKAELAEKEMADMRPKILDAKKQLNATMALEQRAPAEEDILASITSNIPAGSPIAWFPPMMSDFFKRQGVKEVSVRLTRDADAGADLPGFRSLSWVVDVSAVQYAQFGVALAALENEMPLVQITKLDMAPSDIDVETQNVTLILNNLVKK